jgi:hypothetical protein
MTIPSVPVLNVDNDSEDVQIAVNAPTRVRPGDTFEYQVIIINLGASGVFNLSLSASSNPVGNFVDLERVTSPRRARSRIRSNQISLQVSVPAGQTQAVRIRARALPGSGGATFTAFASVSRGNDPAVTAQASTEVDVQAVIVTLNGQHTGESITTDVYAPVLTGFFGAARFHYTIGIVNPNAIMATGVNVTVLQGGGPNIVAGYVHKPGSSYQPLTSFGAEFDLADIPPGTTELSLTALADSSDIGDEYSVSASITGALKGTSFGTLKTGTANTNVKASIEYLFLAGLAALAGQEYLNQRRQRKRRQFGERISDYAAVDELFEKLVP